ncbi:uncharacterized protein [Palaemon carinicauda]|uniref:uncharacterized protein n=1 Tax=Palaemon carinicauda TaxID=392227 RepID=UPI0035B66AB8
MCRSPFVDLGWADLAFLTTSQRDRGPAFLSEIWLALANLMGTTLHSTTAYNPAANRMVETNSSRPQGVRDDGEPSPAERVYGEALAVPGKFFPTSTDDTQLDHLRDIARKFRTCLNTYRDRTKHFKPRSLDDCGYVFVRVDAYRQPLTRPYRGPYRVIKKMTKAFLLDVHGQEDWVSINHVKLAFFEGSNTASVGPGRSRVPPQNMPPNEKKSNKRRQEVAIHMQTSDTSLRSRTRGTLRRPKRYED